MPTICAASNSERPSAAHDRRTIAYRSHGGGSFGGGSGAAHETRMISTVECTGVSSDAPPISKTIESAGAAAGGDAGEAHAPASMQSRVAEYRASEGSLCHAGGGAHHSNADRFGPESVLRK